MCHPLLQSHDFTMTFCTTTHWHSWVYILGVLGFYLSHTHTLTHWPATPHPKRSELQNNLWRHSWCSRSDAHEGGRETSQEDSQRPRKNGFVNRGIQRREGFSKGVFRQTAKGFLFFFWYFDHLFASVNVAITPTWAGSQRTHQHTCPARPRYSTQVSSVILVSLNLWFKLYIVSVMAAVGFIFGNT